MDKIPQSASLDHVTGQVKHGALPRLSLSLIREEEELSKYIVLVFGILTHNIYQIMGISQEIIEI